MYWEHTEYRTVHEARELRVSFKLHSRSMTQYSCDTHFSPQGNWGLEKLIDLTKVTCLGRLEFELRQFVSSVLIMHLYLFFRVCCFFKCSFLHGIHDDGRASMFAAFIGGQASKKYFWAFLEVNKATTQTKITSRFRKKNLTHLGSF